MLPWHRTHVLLLLRTEFTQNFGINSWGTEARHPRRPAERLGGGEKKPPRTSLAPCRTLPDRKIPQAVLPGLSPTAWRTAQPQTPDPKDCGVPSVPCSPDQDLSIQAIPPISSLSHKSQADERVDATPGSDRMEQERLTSGDWVILGSSASQVWESLLRQSGSALWPWSLWRPEKWLLNHF